MRKSELPNGWKVSLSHQYYFSSSTKNYVGIDIKPDFEVRNSQEEVVMNFDPILLKAFEILSDATQN